MGKSGGAQGHREREREGYSETRAMGEGGSVPAAHGPNPVNALFRSSR